MTKLTRKGNAVGMDAKGRTVYGHYIAKSKTWVVNVEGADARRNFATKGEAETYAASLCDAAQTAAKKWW